MATEVNQALAAHAEGLFGQAADRGQGQAVGGQDQRPGPHGQGGVARGGQGGGRALGQPARQAGPGPSCR